MTLVLLLVRTKTHCKRQNTKSFQIRKTCHFFYFWPLSWIWQEDTYLMRLSGAWIIILHIIKATSEFEICIYKFQISEYQFCSCTPNYSTLWIKICWHKICNKNVINRKLRVATEIGSTFFWFLTSYRAAEKV
jgi:hypothetical protein